MWAGIDVGAQKKGFDVAVIDQRDCLCDLRRISKAEDVVRHLVPFAPRIVGVDSPKHPAPTGYRLRECERRLARELCGIRWTPDRQALLSSPYYDWVLNGLELWEGLRGAGISAIEVFPTAAWALWGGALRGSVTRAVWSTRLLQALPLTGIPNRTNQDQRDAIAAAWTAKLFVPGARRHRYWPIVVL